MSCASASSTSCPRSALVEDVYGVDVEDLEDPDAFDVDALFEEFHDFGERLAAEDMTVNASAHGRDGRRPDRHVRGCPGTIIDIDHGTTHT